MRLLEKSKKKSDKLNIIIIALHEMSLQSRYYNKMLAGNVRT